jgi:hypothetical protein
MRKLLIITFCFSLFAVLLTAQENQKTKKYTSTIGAAVYLFGDNDVITSQGIDGSSKTGKGFYAFGVNYILGCNNWLEIETGLEYSVYKFNSSSNSTGQPQEYKSDFALINIPVTARIKFLKYFFVNGGFIFDLDASSSSHVDSQNGVGALLGIAAKYDFNSKFSIFINPCTRIHSLLSFSDDKHHDMIIDTAFRLGITCKIN